MNTKKPHPRYVIIDALASTYGSVGDDPATDGSYWGVGADLIVTSLIDAGLVPPEFDAVADTTKASTE